MFHESQWSLNITSYLVASQSGLVTVMVSRTVQPPATHGGILFSLPIKGEKYYVTVRNASCVICDGFIRFPKDDQISFLSVFLCYNLFPKVVFNCFTSKNNKVIRYYLKCIKNDNYLEFRIFLKFYLAIKIFG